MALLGLKKSRSQNYLLATLLALFIVFPMQLPESVKQLVDTIIGKIVIFIVVLNLFLLDPLTGALGMLAAYELVQRSEHFSSVLPNFVGARRAVVPRAKARRTKLTLQNQFPLTVEEMVVAKQIPYTFNLKTASNAPYRPLQAPLPDAAAKVSP